MIEIRGLQKVVDGNLALDIESLTVAAGETVAVVGAVGSGRNVLLDLLVGRTRLTAGTLRLAGAEPVDRAAFSRQVGVLFAEDGLYRSRSPLANLAFHCRLYDLPRSRAEEVLVQVGLSDQANARLERLPSGLARRLAFGRAILHRPVVLLLEEPFVRCDEASIALLSRLMRQLADDGCALLILADHTAHLLALCDTVYALDRGRLVESARPQAESQADLPFKIPVRMQDKVVLVNPAEILYADAGDGRAILHTAEAHLPTQFTLAELEQRLARSGFFRAHRAYLVNLQHIREVIPYTRNSFSLCLDDPAATEIPLSKAAAGELRELLGY
jgi:ABC-2 type transport system ATP-binding protein